MSARRFSRVQMGAVLLVLTFLPFLPIRFAPEFWAEVPTWARWVAYLTGGASFLGLLSLVFTADYGEAPGTEEA